METLKAIHERVSMRKFEKNTMKQEDIHTILEAGFEAPSAMNRRPYEFIVNVDNNFWHDFSKLKPTCEIIASASLSVVVIGDANKNPTEEFLIEDCSCVAENMLLAAKDIGYDSLWAGVKWHSEFYDELIRYFHFPQGYVPIAVLCFGKGAEKKAPVDRYDAAKVHQGSF
jgi:nitroreductase